MSSHSPTGACRFQPFKAYGDSDLIGPRLTICESGSRSKSNTLVTWWTITTKLRLCRNYGDRTHITCLCLRLMKSVVNKNLRLEWRLVRGPLGLLSNLSTICSLRSVHNTFPLNPLIYDVQSCSMLSHQTSPRCIKSPIWIKIRAGVISRAAIICGSLAVSFRWVNSEPNSRLSQVSFTSLRR